MRKILFAATILAAGAMPLLSAEAATRFVIGGQTVTSDTGISTIREANEAPRREDRQADRRDGRHSSKAIPGTTTQAREASEAPRGKDSPTDTRGRHSSNVMPGGFDPSGIVLAREAGEGPRGEGKGHP